MAGLVFGSNGAPTGYVPPKNAPSKIDWNGASQQYATAYANQQTQNNTISQLKAIQSGTSKLNRAQQYGLIDSAAKQGILQKNDHLQLTRLIDSQNDYKNEIAANTKGTGNFLLDKIVNPAVNAVKNVGTTLGYQLQPGAKASVNQGLAKLQSDFQNGYISQDQLKTVVQQRYGAIIGNDLKVTKNGIENQNAVERGASVLGQGADAGLALSSFVPAGAGAKVGIQAIKDAATVAAEDGGKATGAQIFKQAAGATLKNNAKLAGVFGTVQTGADALNGRPITPESLATNYGTPFVLGTAAEGAGRSVASVLRAGANARLARLNAGTAALEAKSGGATDKLLPALDKAKADELTSPQKIPVTGESTSEPVTVTKPNQMSGTDYAKQFNAISKSYDKQTAALEKMPPVQQKIMQQAIETKHQQMLDTLDKQYKNPSMQAIAPPKAPRGVRANTVKSITGDSEAAAQTSASKAALPAQATVQVVKSDGTKTYVPLTSKEAVNAAQKKIDFSESGSAGNKDASGNTYHVTARTPAEMEARGFTQEGDTKIAGQFAEKTPTLSASDQRTAGSATNAESRAIEGKLATHFDEKASYNGLSFKEEAKKAADLVHENPDRANKIALGLVHGDNSVHEAAVLKAVENEAIKNGDSQTLANLATSKLHTETSEAAQRLGATGYVHDPTSPVESLRAIINGRKAVAAKRYGDITEAAKSETAKIKAAIKVTAPKKDDWTQLIEELRC